MKQIHEADILILGGLPVTVEYVVNPPEPDVGISSPWIDEYQVVAVAGRSTPKNNMFGKVKGRKPVAWVHKKIDATKGEDDRICTALLEQHSEEADYDY